MLSYPFLSPYHDKSIVAVPLRGWCRHHSDTTGSAIQCNAWQAREQKPAYLCGVCKAVQTSSSLHIVTLRDISGLIEAGKLRPVIDRSYPLREVPQAIRYLEQGHARGKVVLTVSN
jgi:NADPH:quinone reductase-like Zn-dependent oxidoreductase